MQRETQTPRPDWQKSLEQFGFNIHHFAGKIYWAEDTSYKFSLKQAMEIEAATNTLHQLCLAAVQHIINRHLAGDNRLIEHFGIPELFWPDVVASWQSRQPHVYGRFDLQYDGVNPPKMLEYNADTPTSLFESAILQWHWVQESKPGHEQFNALHERLVSRWAKVLPAVDGTLPLIHFAGCSDAREDFICYQYLRDTAAQAGLNTKSMDMSEIGWDEAARKFVDKDGEVIERAFKLYPWEHMARDGFADCLLEHKVQWFEPSWKMLLSNKALLPVLWELNPGHPNLLKASFSVADFAGEDHVIKPKLSREGANVTIVIGGEQAQKTKGIYNEGDAIYQAYAPLPEFDGFRPVLGAWVIGDQASGLGIREDAGYITGNDSRFIPHYIAG